VRGALKDRCERIEGCYEFMLAYASRGLQSTAGDPSSSEVRGFLTQCDEALTGLADLFTQLIEREQFHSADRYHAFIGVLDRDARDAQAAVRLVLAQNAISSQLVDNLNASIHLRALLTDLFLIDEIIRPA
jgi:hypothetical protein